MPTARLENWTTICKSLYGEIHDDEKKRWEDGHPIKVSRFEHPPVAELKEGDIVVTNNSSYLLGKRIG